MALTRLFSSISKFLPIWLLKLKVSQNEAVCFLTSKTEGDKVYYCAHEN
jgi:hypothetical protein